MTNNSAVRWRGWGKERGNKKFNIKEDDLNVNKIKKEVQNIDGYLCRIWKLQETIFANALLEKGARNAFETVE